MKIKCFILYSAVAAVLLLVTAPDAGAQALSVDKHDVFAMQKSSDDVLIYLKLMDIARVDKVQITGPPKAHQKPTGSAFKDSLLDNQFKFFTYIFFPKDLKKGKKYPLIVFPHGGIMSSVTPYYCHIFRELIAQGYIVVAPDYRGSTGYGKSYLEAIDYGALENDDVLAARDYMVENYSVVDPDRIGILGYSHGGMITLMNVLQWPDKYACAYAGVPVSDLIYRLGYQNKLYVRYFNQSYHINATPEEKPEEYARRSPITYAANLSKPLKITTCVNDDDVSVTEVRRMAEALRKAGKAFEYEEYPEMPGAHLFEIIDTREAADIRFKTYQFLAKYLKPKHPFKNVAELREASYFYY